MHWFEWKKRANYTSSNTVVSTYVTNAKSKDTKDESPKINKKEINVAQPIIHKVDNALILDNALIFVSIQKRREVLGDALSYLETIFMMMLKGTGLQEFQSRKRSVWRLHYNGRSDKEIPGNIYFVELCRHHDNNLTLDF